MGPLSVQPSGVLDLYLIRHAQTAPNAERRYPAAGQDAPLSEQGRRQAAALRLPLADVVYASPTLRAVQTAEGAGYTVDVQTAALLEAAFGTMHGRTWAELEAEYGQAPASWIRALSDPDNHAGPPGGDSGVAFHGRVQGWLAALPDSGTVLAFSHLGTVLAALRLTVGLRAADLPPCSVAHLRQSGGAWWLVSLLPGPL
ncbi:histidine phosphatase family protein [Deinococcus sp. KNUC1210]|uniref:histidine phosphatase family protein n=1 Tax=Deinococcus sp. KNUC1210 TaxID=2917691 RepID=UPI001EF0D5B2|nr:histidine phosphatase family protein [Deinococcus sp. KNUC1210]ULH15697.1 histidine phosphatase family protein [Deinococcus sp. KNUC1210]